MRIFITGATGFIGTSVIRELRSAGYEVLGMARSDAGAEALTNLGAEVHRGSLEDPESLKRGAAEADGVIHLGFIHVFLKLAENCIIDKNAIEAMGSVLAGSAKPLIVTAGLAGLGAPGRVATEDDTIPPDFPFPRVSEQTALALPGVNALVMRLPQVHDTAKQGLITYLVQMAREKNVSAYVGDGQIRWAATHVSDVARAYRLALEKGQSGDRYHVVAEEGVPMRDIAEAIGKRLGVAVKSLSPEDVPGHFGWMGALASLPLSGSSRKTREKLGWEPTGPNLLEDLAQLVKS